MPRRSPSSRLYSVKPSACSARRQPRIEPIANFLGLARADAGDLDGAVSAFRTALAIAERVQGGTGGNRGIDHFTLGRALAAQRHRQGGACCT